MAVLLINVFVAFVAHVRFQHIATVRHPITDALLDSDEYKVIVSYTWKHNIELLVKPNILVRSSHIPGNR